MKYKQTELNNSFYFKDYYDEERLKKDPLYYMLACKGVWDIEHWLMGDESNINSPWAFNKAAVNRVIEMLKVAIQYKKRICVIVDADADGYTSAAIILNYLYELYKLHDDISIDEIKERLTYIMHDGKQHGLEDCYNKIAKNIQLVIIPDAGTNDILQMKKLVDKGIQVICMDHHESEEWLEDENVAIINNQICDYPNKDLSGAGVTWQMCRAYDGIINLNLADKYIDLAALGCLSDMMSYKSLETRAIIKKGLNNIKNPFFYYMVEKNKYSIDKMGGINYMSIAFYVTPFINAIVRSGTPEEKDLVFKSMLTMYAFDKVKSGKRGHLGEFVPRVEEAVRVAANVKARQTKLQDAAMDIVEQRIKDYGLTKNYIIAVPCEPKEVEKNLAGLVANKIQAKYQHPCLILIRSKEKDDKEYYYRGSARNYSMSENQDLRATCLKTDLVEYAQGHANAFGLSISESNLDKFIEFTNKEYENISKEPVYWVDFVWGLKDIDPKIILTIAEAKDLWGQEIPEPYVAIHDIPLKSVSLLSPDKHPTCKIHLDNGVDIMKFKSSQEEYEMFIRPNMVLTAVCRCAVNEWAGRKTAQLIIEDFYLSERWIF